MSPSAIIGTGAVSIFQAINMSVDLFIDRVASYKLCSHVPENVSLS